MTMVWETGIGPATKRLVLLALADSANDEGVCWPSVTTIARKANASKRRTEEVLAELHADGIVTRCQRFNDTNVYEINLGPLRQAIAAPREDCTPREKQQTPPANLAPPPARTSGVTVKEQPEQEPTTSAAVATGAQLPLLPAGSEVEPEKPGRKGTGAPTVNQRAVRLAQAHYDRMGGFGNVPAWTKIIRKAVERDFTVTQITAALEHIAAQRWTLTEERLANTLRGGPRPATGPAPAGRRPIARTANGMEIQR